MLSLRPNCEHCGKDLPYDATDAMICSFECTFCEECVETILNNVCPNCGGGFTKRPIRPRRALERYPASTERVYKPVDPQAHQRLSKQYSQPPEQR